MAFTIYFSILLILIGLYSILFPKVYQIVDDNIYQSDDIFIDVSTRKL